MPGPNQPTQPGQPSPYPAPLPLHFEPPFQSPPPSQSERWQQFLAQRQQDYAQQIQHLAQAQPWSGAFNPQPNPLLAPGAPLLRQTVPGRPDSIFLSTLGEAEPMDQMGLLQAMMGRG